MRVVRILTYEGPAEWLEKQVGNSLSDGKHGKDGSGAGRSIFGASCPGSITLQTVVDERPSQVPDPDVVKLIEEGGPG